ncbi:hypothetical protein BBD42_16245 [Paenibacillus sp. BIHB 4019]|uniref:Uncharacterized protein n=1 Tax=Paenibacillus sp. BIHB 4019 TaxID=1870819 RepID=A0A1B2DJE0_9BACL|nr:hypothetical protein [Paenibacillus sp. BIHB 4019]ANY67850.1 hypothetical protein BBD42_16245 [Paenibacillus sp. BIHB 4019]
MKLFRLHELENLNYIELFPRRYTGGGYLKPESVYLTDDAFSFIVPAVKRGFEGYDPFNCFVLERSQWKIIMNEVEKQKEFLIKYQDEKLEEYISIFYKERTLRACKLEEFQMIRQEIISLLKDFLEWIESQLEINEFITLIGI